MDHQIRTQAACACIAAMTALAATAGRASAQVPRPVGGDGPLKGRRAAAPDVALPDGLRPSLARAIDGVHRFERACLDLGLLGPDGAVDPSAFEGADDARLDEITEFLREGVEGMYPGAGAFAFGERGAPLEQLVECGRYHAGWLAARRALGEDPELTPAHALAALADDVLSAPPLEGSEAAQRFAERASSQRRFAPLGNGGLCFVVWGLLHEPAFWGRGGLPSNAREELIHAIVTMGATSELATWTATRVLRPPLARRDDRPGRGVAFSAGEDRGRVGFTERDEAFVRRVRDRILRGEMPARPAGDAGSSGDTGNSRTTGAAGAAPGPSEKRLRAWCATMLHWILSERGTVPTADDAMRRGTFDERVQYWTDLARRVSFDDFRAAYVDELVALGSRAEGLGAAERIAELEALAESRAADGGLGPDEAAELERLRLDAERARTRLVRHMADLLVQSGAADHFAAVAATLAGPTESLLADIAPHTARAHWLGDAWIRLGLTPNEQATWVLDDHLDGVGPLPDYGLESLVMSTASWSLPGAEATLGRVLSEGDLAARSAAVVNPGWMSEERFESEWRRLARDHDAEGADPVASSKARVSLVLSLAQRDDAAARRLLLESFEEGRWRDPSDPRCWSNVLFGASRDRVLGALSPEERQGLVDRGLAPPELLGR